jgi:hypothetical protein
MCELSLFDACMDQEVCVSAKTRPGKFKGHIEQGLDITLKSIKERPKALPASVKQKKLGPRSQAKRVEDEGLPDDCGRYFRTVHVAQQSGLECECAEVVRVRLKA